MFKNQKGCWAPADILASPCSWERREGLSCNDTHIQLKVSSYPEYLILGPAESLNICRATPTDISEVSEGLEYKVSEGPSTFWLPPRLPLLLQMWLVLVMCIKLPQQKVFFQLPNPCLSLILNRKLASLRRQELVSSSIHCSC